jgi:hypothetical protein
MIQFLDFLSQRCRSDDAKIDCDAVFNTGFINGG